MGDLLHALAAVARALLDGAVGFFFAQAAGHELLFGLVDELARGQLLAEFGGLLLEGLGVGEAADGDGHGRGELVGPDGFDQVAVDGQIGGALDEVGFAEGGEQEDGQGWCG